MAESQNAVKWLSENKMIVIPDIFKPIIQKSKQKKANLNSKKANLQPVHPVTFVNLLPSNLMLL